MQRALFLDGILERTATRFLRRIHRITHRMPVKLRAIEKQRVLVVAPHPDDEVIAIGGNLALHQRLGSEVLTLFVTLDAPLPMSAEKARPSASLAFSGSITASWPFPTVRSPCTSRRSPA